MSTIDKTDLPDANIGFEFLGNAVRWMDQDLNKKLPTGYQFADNNDRWRVDIQAKDNNTTWLLSHYNIDRTNRKSVPYFAVNLMLAKRMGWVVEKSSKCLKWGLIYSWNFPMEKNSVKPDPATCLNAKFTFNKPIHVVEGLLYHCSAFSWRFVNLNEAFKKATTDVFETPKAQTNVFKQWMTNISLWRMSSGLRLDNYMLDLPVSPHYWNPKALSVTVLEGVTIVEGVSRGVYNGEIEKNMSGLMKSNTYTIALEWYQKDEWLFNHSQFSTDGIGLEIRNLTVSKHTHEYSKTHLIYYHTLAIQFTKSVTGYAYLNVQFEIGYPLPSTYPDELKDNTFLVLYGVKGHVNHVPEVYDDHPIIHSSHTTTDTTTESTGIKTASKTPRDHGRDKSRPLFMYCNLTKSQHGNNALMKAFAYNNEKTLIERNPLQFYSLRGQLLDIVEVT